MKEPHLYFPKDCVVGRFVERYKRFFVVALINGEAVHVHTNNTGSMLGLLRPGSPVLLSPAKGQKRKLAWTLELIWTGGKYPYEEELNTFPTLVGGRTPFHWGQGFWVGVNTSIPNKIFEKAFYDGLFPWAEGYSIYRREVKKGTSRLDACLEGEGLPPLWVECKNVTLVEDNIAIFPDAVSERGVKHLLELKSIVKNGERAAMFYCVQRADGVCFGPADVVDHLYAQIFWSVQKCGVEMYPYRINITTKGLCLGERLDLFIE